MRLVVQNPLQIHWFVNYLFGFSIIVQKNRMIQIASCEPAFSCYVNQFEAQKLAMFYTSPKLE